MSWFYIYSTCRLTKIIKNQRVTLPAAICSAAKSKSLVWVLKALIAWFFRTLSFIFVFDRVWSVVTHIIACCYLFAVLIRLLLGLNFDTIFCMLEFLILNSRIRKLQVAFSWQMRLKLLFIQGSTLSSCKIAGPRSLCRLRSPNLAAAPMETLKTSWDDTDCAASQGGWQVLRSRVEFSGCIYLLLWVFWTL